MPYKDETSLLLGHKIKDKVSKLESELSKHKAENTELKDRLRRLENNNTQEI